MPRSSTFSDRQNTILRNGFLIHKSRQKRYLRKEKLQDLERNWTDLSTNNLEISFAASKFCSNCSTRAYDAIQVDPCIIRNALSLPMQKQLQKFAKSNLRTSVTDVSNLLSGEKGNTSAAIKNVTSSKAKCVSNLKLLAFKIMREKILCRTMGKTCEEWALNEFDYQVDQGHLPLNISVVAYEEGETQGMIPHKDAYAMFGAIIFILTESLEGCLQVPILNLSTPLPQGSAVVINPNTLHDIPIVYRTSTRCVIVVTL